MTDLATLRARAEAALAAGTAYTVVEDPQTILRLLDRLDAARFVAEHWRDAYMEYVKEGQNQYGIGTHPLSLVLAALDGETDPQPANMPDPNDWKWHGDWPGEPHGAGDGWIHVHPDGTQWFHPEKVCAALAERQAPR